MKLAEMVAMLQGQPLLTVADLAQRWRVSDRRVRQIRQEDPRFPRPHYVRGPRWTPDEIDRYERLGRREVVQ